MDPDAALRLILSEICSDEPDREYILDTLIDLHKWIEDGGLLPTVTDDGESYLVSMS